LRSKSFWLYLGAILILFASRLISMSRALDFFDAPEYLWRTAEPTLVGAMSTGHPPFHPLYLFFSFIFYRFFHFDLQMATVLPAVIFGSLSIIVVFLLVRRLFGQGIAWLVAIFYALIPFVFISQITILIDPVEHFFYFLSLLFLVFTLERRKGEYWWALLGGLALGLAAFAHTQVAFWLTGHLSVLVLKNKDWSAKNLKRLLVKVILFSLAGSVFVFLYLELLVYASSYDYTAALRSLLLGNAGEKEAIGPIEAVRRILTVSTGIVSIFGFLGLVVLGIKKKWRELLALLIWFLPSTYLASRYIYENLHGRAMIIGLVPLLILAAYFLLSLKFWWRIAALAVLVIQLLAITTPAVWLYRFRLPQNQALAAVRSAAASGGVFVSSNISRTWNGYNGEFISFGDVGSGSGQVEKEALKALENGKGVFISGDAIRLPFRRYDGHFFDIRSVQTCESASHPTLLSGVFQKMAFVLDQASPYLGQTVYRVFDDRSGDYLSSVSNNLAQSKIIFGRVQSAGMPVSVLTVNDYADRHGITVREDITRFDAFFYLYRLIKGAGQLVDWTFTDKNGMFFLPFDNNAPKLVLASSAINTKSSDLNGSFPEQSETQINGQLVQSFDNLSELKNKLGMVNGSYYVIAQKINAADKFDLYSFSYELPKTEILEAENMSGEIGGARKDKSASGGKIRTNTVKDEAGYLISGPYADLPAGKYQLDFVLRAKSEFNPEALLDFDVFSESGGRTYQSKTVAAKDLKENDFTNITLQLDLAQSASNLEFRLKTPGGVSVDIDYLRLKRNP